MVKINISSNFESASSTDVRRHSCIDIDECESFSSHCPQSCTNLKGSYKCDCAENYLDLHGDGSICEAGWKEDSVILIAYGSEIRQLRQNFSNVAYTTLIEDDNLVLTMEIDPVDRIVYWIDESLQQVKRSFIPVSKTALGHPQLLSALDVSSSTSFNFLDLTAISIDWLGKNLYYAEGINGTIKVSKSDGRYSKTIIKDFSERIYSMAVNPIIGLVKLK